MQLIFPFSVPILIKRSAGDITFKFFLCMLISPQPQHLTTKNNNKDVFSELIKEENSLNSCGESISINFWRNNIKQLPIYARLGAPLSLKGVFEKFSRLIVELQTKNPQLTFSEEFSMTWKFF